MAKIYVSSTFSDLKEYRAAVYDALRALRHDVIAMEDYVATDQRPLDKCLADVAASDIYVGIFAWRYGFIPDQDNPEQKSITELEYRCAVRHGKPCLIFLLDENAEWPRAKMEKGEGQQRIEAFRQELADRYVASFFTKHDDLAHKVVTAVAALLVNAATPVQEEKQKVEIARLPNMLTNDLFGREKEVQMLNEAWANPQTNVIAFVAFGGSGKSALVHHWVHEVMAKDNYRGAARVYAWSFWSQGSDQPQTSADPFIDAALRWFGDQDPTAGSPWDKGERLARLIKQTRTLLILDGLEPLQHPKHTLEGRLKEQSMQALLKELAAGQPGLCVVSTREHVADLQGFRAPAVIAHDLEQLSPEAGASILRQQQIKGSDAELQQASAEFGNHALALTILASFLHNAYDGDIRKRHEIGPLTEDLANGGHARRVMSTYETWLRDAGEDTLLAVLRVLGLFNRPADAAALAALRAAPAIPDLTEALLPLSESQWKQMLAKLRRLKLLTDSSTSDGVDAHPLLREHFRDQLQRAQPAAWQAGNLRLYEHLTRTAKEFPDTLEEMQPLFAAVTHGCAAGIQQETYDKLYLRRISRMQEYFSTNKLGAVGQDLITLSHFFKSRWSEPSATLNDTSKVDLLSRAGFRLRASGRIADAIQPMNDSLELATKLAHWENATICAGNVSQLFLLRGNCDEALDYAYRSVELSNRGQVIYQQIGRRTALAEALHCSGNLSKAATIFQEAESTQEQMQPQYPRLLGFRGYRYCELLLDQGKYETVLSRVKTIQEWGQPSYSLLDKALDHLLLGKGYSFRPNSHESKSGFFQAIAYLDQAVEQLRQSGEQHQIPRGLLARAAWARVAQQFDRAHRDLAEACTIAERGEMRLHLTDYHLESARLALAEGNNDTARDHYDKARQLIAETGYHRRDGELKEIEEQLG